MNERHRLRKKNWFFFFSFNLTTICSLCRAYRDQQQLQQNNDDKIYLANVQKSRKRKRKKQTIEIEAHTHTQNDSKQKKKK